MTPKPKSLAWLALLSLVAALQLAATAAEVPAAKFDEKLKAPAASTNEQLKVAIREYFDVYARATAESLAGMVRNKAAHAKWYDTQWLLQRAIDTKRDLGDLSEFGLAAKNDKSHSYSVDVANFPQWSPLQSDMLRLLEPEIVKAYAPDLKARGFRDSDIDIISAYAHKHDPHAEAYPEKLVLGETFANTVKERLAKKQEFGAPLMLDYLYQNSRVQFEAYRAWTEGLLDSLDPQRQRILESFFGEQNRSSSMAIGPDDIEGAAIEMRSAIASGEYSRMLKEEKAKMQTTEVPQ